MIFLQLIIFPKLLHPIPVVLLLLLHASAKLVMSSDLIWCCPLHSRYNSVDQCFDPAHLKAKLEALKDRLGHSNAPRLFLWNICETVQALVRETSAALDCTYARFKVVLMALGGDGV